MDFSIALNLVRGTSVCFLSSLPRLGLCAMTTSASRGRHTQLIPMETLNIKLRFLPAFCLGGDAGTQQPSGTPEMCSALHEGSSRLCAGLGLMPPLCQTPTASGKSEEQLCVHCHVSQRRVLRASNIVVIPN